MKPGFQTVPPGSYYKKAADVWAVKKTVKKTITALLIMLLATSTAGGLSFAAAEDPETPQQTAETLLTVLDTRRAEVLALFDSIVEGGGEVPEDAQESFDEADGLRDEAQALYDAGDYEEAIEEATEAINKYGEATSLAMETDEDEGTEPEEDEDEDDGYGVIAGYEKAVDRLEKLKAIAEALEAQGMDVSEADALILEAEDSLSQLEEALNQGDLGAAGSLLGESNGTLGKLTAALKTIGKPKKKEKMEHFINQTRHRVQQLETKMLRILAKYGLTEEDEQAIKAEFQAMIAGLDDIDVDRDDLGETVNSLKRLVKETNRVGKGKDVDEEVVDKIKKLNKHESNLNRYRERITELEGLGAPTDELLGLLNEAEGLLSQADDEMNAGNKDAAEDLIDEADAILDTLDDMIDDLEKEYEDLDEEEDGKKGKGNNGKAKNETDDETDDDFEKNRQKIEEEVAELEEKIAELREEGEDTSELEAELDEIKDALEQAENVEDLEALEERLDALDDRIDDLEDSGSGADEGGEGEEPGEGGDTG
jgi:chromosome segregation ATPase